VKSDDPFKKKASREEWKPEHCNCGNQIEPHRSGSRVNSVDTVQVWLNAQSDRRVAEVCVVGEANALTAPGIQEEIKHAALLRAVVGGILATGTYENIWPKDLQRWRIKYRIVVIDDAARIRLRFGIVDHSAVGHIDHFESIPIGQGAVETISYARVTVKNHDVDSCVNDEDSARPDKTREWK
jgi:hypothetical protein